MRRAASVLALAIAVAGCETFDPKHPSVGAPTIDPAHSGYFVWYGGDSWHLRAIAGNRPHRFQGTVAGASGSILDMAPSEKALADQIALVGDAVQFDFESGGGQPGFDLRVAGNCARFDLLLDGKRSASRVKIGPRAHTPSKVPFERCP
jgi:hypothetical protein